jgi:hypothetical protein
MHLRGQAANVPGLPRALDQEEHLHVRSLIPHCRSFLLLGASLPQAARQRHRHVPVLLLHLQDQLLQGDHSQSYHLKKDRRPPLLYYLDLEWKLLRL